MKDEVSFKTTFIILRKLKLLLDVCMFNRCSEMKLVVSVLYSDEQLVNQSMLRHGTGTMRSLGRSDVL